MRFQVIRRHDGSFRWVLYNRSGTPTVHSSGSFATAERALADIADTQAAVAAASMTPVGTTTARP
jgi:hypothetical protein